MRTANSERMRRSCIRIGPAASSLQTVGSDQSFRKERQIHRLESRMREIRTSGLAGGEAGINRPSLPRSRKGVCRVGVLAHRFLPCRIPSTTKSAGGYTHPTKHTTARARVERQFRDSTSIPMPVAARAVCGA
jgi:hypothetical protein